MYICIIPAKHSGHYLSSIVMVLREILRRGTHQWKDVEEIQVLCDHGKRLIMVNVEGEKHIQLNIPIIEVHCNGSTRYAEYEVEQSSDNFSIFLKISII